ncbi:MULTISPECIES: calcium-binding protein [Paenibacillus]|nr:calcium-binding protein [Paenibacillus borealis]
MTLSDWNGTVRGRPFRKIAIAAVSSLYDLAVVTIESFDFDLDHGFGFYDNIKNWSRSEKGYELFADIGEKMKFPGLKGAKISKVFHTPKQKLLLLFDYGDEWHFIVQYIGDTKLKPGQKLPLIMETKGEAPDQYGGFEDEDETQAHDRAEEPEREERIVMEIIVDAYDEEEKAMGWYYYLKDKIHFPFMAKCNQTLAKSPLKSGEQVTVIQMAPESECLDGMWVQVEWQNRKFAVPLVQLQPIEPDEDTTEAIEDWVYWTDLGYSF